MSMQYISMELGPIMTNCYIVYDSDTKEAMVVDPAWAYNTIDMALSRYELDLKFIFLTHGHADHIGALQELRQRKNVPVYVGAGDAGLISNSH
ncbi:MAG: MBL fold metallo-hydrolase, partial [Megasphaera sp.]|nr:MBL fold metallo-hydrolase [Megasphaera sp.]